MNGLLVFNSANDIVFQQLNDELTAKVRDIALTQGLITSPDAGIDTNILLQIFTPIISSQKIMFCQFDNTYSSFQCDNGLNFAFSDFLGYAFIKIGQRPVAELRRHLGVSIALARHLYGANLFAAPQTHPELLADCINCYEQQYDEDQALMLEALPYIIINAELKRVVQNTLRTALERLRESGHQRTHVLMFVGNKFVASKSSKLALPLSATDLLFLSLLLRTLQHNTNTSCNTNNNNSSNNNRKPHLQRSSVPVFLQGESHHAHSGCVPCIAHFARLEKGVLLIQLIEYAPLQVASSIYDTFFVLQKIISVQLQGDLDGIKPAFESLETFVKQTLDSMKRAKLRGDEVDLAHKRFAAKWENLRKMYAEYVRSYDRELLIRIESNIMPFVEELRQLFNLTCCDSSSISLDPISDVAAAVEGDMLEFAEFLTVKAERNLSIVASLEDFPGLVHFIYINRSKGLMLAPDFQQNKLLPKKWLWSMIEFTRNYLKRGQTSIVWRDKVLSYSYFLWFEDQANGAPKSSINLEQHFINPSIMGNSTTWKTQYEPGLLAHDYYQQLVELCFPKTAAGKIKCCELFCIHLGLVTAACAAEHSRQLVATIADVMGGGYNF